MFNINFQVEGLEEVKYILAELSKTGNHYRAVELKGLERKDSAANNAEVLDYLGKSGRKFGELFPDEPQIIAQAAAVEFESRIAKELARLQRLAKRNAREVGKSLGLKGKALTAVGKAASSAVTSITKTEQWSRQTAGAILTEAMRVFMTLVKMHIDAQRAVGGVKNFTSESYRKWKENTFGFAYPIGKATGQLMENLDETFAAREIVLRKK